MISKAYFEIIVTPRNLLDKKRPLLNIAEKKEFEDILLVKYEAMLYGKLLLQNEKIIIPIRLP